MEAPARIAHLFWDCDLALVDPQKHMPFVLSRTMCRIEDTVVSWLRQTYEPEALRTYLYDDGARKLGPREIDYWCAALGVGDPLRAQWLVAAQVRTHSERTVAP